MITLACFDDRVPSCIPGHTYVKEAFIAAPGGGVRDPAE